MMTPTFPADDRFVRMREIRARTGLSRSTLYRRIEEGKFPAPRKDGRCAIWLESELVAYMAKIAGSADDSGH